MSIYSYDSQATTRVNSEASPTGQNLGALAGPHAAFAFQPDNVGQVAQEPRMHAANPLPNFGGAADYVGGAGDGAPLGGEIVSIIVDPVTLVRSYRMQSADFGNPWTKKWMVETSGSPPSRDTHRSQQSTIKGKLFNHLVRNDTAVPPTLKNRPWHAINAFYDPNHSNNGSFAPECWCKDDAAGLKWFLGQQLGIKFE